jgi:hypothetical protein
MIEVSLLSAGLSAEQLQELSVQLTNSGHGPCTNIVLRLAWPREISLIQGSDRIEEARLDPGQSIVRVLRVRPKQAGTWQLTSPNFSYRDQWGQTQRITGWGLEFVVEPAPIVSAPAIVMTLHTVELPLNEWDTLEGRIANTGQTDLQQLAIRAAGPITCDSLWRAPGWLRAGETVDFQIPIRVNEGGSKVPIHIEATYTDVAGRANQHAQSCFVSARVSDIKSKGQGVAGEEDLEALIAQHKRHLYELKKQAATFGTWTPPHITIGIENTEAEIAKLKAQCNSAKGTKT